MLTRETESGGDSAERTPPESGNTGMEGLSQWQSHTVLGRPDTPGHADACSVTLPSARTGCPAARLPSRRGLNWAQAPQG